MATKRDELKVREWSVTLLTLKRSQHRALCPLIGERHDRTATSIPQCTQDREVLTNQTLCKTSSPNEQFVEIRGCDVELTVDKVGLPRSHGA